MQVLADERYEESIETKIAPCLEIFVEKTISLQKLHRRLPIFSKNFSPGFIDFQTRYDFYFDYFFVSSVAHDLQTLTRKFFAKCNAHFCKVPLARTFVKIGACHLRSFASSATSHAFRYASLVKKRRWNSIVFFGREKRKCFSQMISRDVLRTSTIIIRLRESDSNVIWLCHRYASVSR